MADEEGEGGDINKKGKINEETAQDDQNKKAKDEVPVSILKSKKVKVSFEGYDEPDHPGVSYDPGITDNYSDDEDDGEGMDVPNDIQRPKRKSIMKSRSLAGLSIVSTFSTYSSVYVDPAFGFLTAVVFFKILFVDICASVGDNVTDFLQGFNLIFDLRKIWDCGFVVRDKTWGYGILVLVMNWVPGVVAAIHILSFHRDEYFSVRKEESSTGSDMVDAKIKRKQKARKKRYITVLLLCLFFYPIVPPVVHFLVMCQMNSQQDTIAFSRTQLFAGIARSISGCVESPLQLIVTLWLMMTGVIDVPFVQASTSLLKDKFDNTLPIPEISAISMLFSLFNILTSAIQINIMSVYIGDIKNMKGFRKFINLSASHFPFFLSAILFRLSSFAYLGVYLNYKLLIPVILILMANLFIGLASYGMYRLPKKITRELSQIRKERRKKENNPALIKLRKNKTKSFDSPIWLNTLLSLFVPCCFVHEIDHLVIEQMKESYQIEREKILKTFQQKILRYESSVSTLIHLTSIAIVFFLVNIKYLNHNYNIYSNTTFNIYSTVLLVQGSFSLFFCWNLDIFETLHLNEAENKDQVDFPMKEKNKKSDKRVTIQDEVEVKEISEEEDFRSISMDEDDNKKKSNTGIKGLVALFLGALVVSPLCIGYGLHTSFGKEESAYVIVKAQESTNFTIRITSAFILNPYHNDTTLTGYLDTCQDCSKTENNSDKILLADLNAEGRPCKKTFEEGCFKKYKAIILLEPWKWRTSSPYPHKVCKQEEEDDCYSIANLFEEENLTVVSIREPETSDFRDLAKLTRDQKKQVDISFKTLYKILDKGNITGSDLFKIDCDEYFKKEGSCINLFSTESYYLGCKGIPRIQEKLNIICKDKERECPALESWYEIPAEKSQIDCEEKEGKIMENEGSNLSPITCGLRNPNMPPLTCRLRDNKIPYIEISKRYCKNSLNEGDPFQWSQDKKFKHTADCSDTSYPTDCDWGSWSDWGPSDAPCRKQERYRFCRKSSNCILYEDEDNTKC